MSSTRAVRRSRAASPAPTIAIVGAGFGGVGLAIALRRAGITTFTLFERGDDVGGTWRENTYPGAACDVPSHLYSFSFAPNAHWTSTYARQPEILAYLRACADRFGVREHLRVRTGVESAVYDDARALWRLELSDGSAHEAQILVTACGQLNQPLVPKLPGAPRFVGAAWHSARWRHDVDLRGARVAVVGTGASAIQFVPEIAKLAAHVDLYQRTPPYVMARADSAYPGWLKRLYALVPPLQRANRLRHYVAHELRALGFTRFAKLLDVAKRATARQLERHVPDAELRRTLTPDYPPGCKRILISNDYYAALARPNVSVVTADIAEVESDGIRTADGTHRDADVIVYGTGFAASDFLTPMRVTGAGGRELSDAWRHGAEAFLGISVSGFPNFFMLYGPNTNLGHNSIVYMLESQIRYVLDALRTMRRGGLRTIDVRPHAQSAFNAHVAKRMARTVWAAGCTSWYVDASGRNSINWPGFTFDYRRRTRKLRLPDYETVAARESLATS